MAYADLSTEQTSQYDSWVRDARAWMGSLQRVINQAEALKDAYNGDDGINSLHDVGGAWLDTEDVPNKSGLQGSASLQKLDVAQIVNRHINKLLIDASTYTTGFNTPSLRQDRVAAAGPMNTL